MIVTYEEFTNDCKNFYGDSSVIHTCSELGILTLINIMYGYPNSIIINDETRTIEIN